MTGKEALLDYYENGEETDRRNRMGCSENWYNSFYSISHTFSKDEINGMSENEADNLIRLADRIAEALY